MADTTMTDDTDPGGQSPGYSRIFWALKNDGPQTADDLSLTGGISPDERRLYDIRGFNVRANSPGKHSSTGRTASIYYLNEYHAPETVLRTWLAENRETLERKGTTRETFDRALSGSFHDAWLDMQDDLGVQWIPDGWHRENSEAIAEQARDSDADHGECTLCGRPLTHSLPTHLRKHDGDCTTDQNEP